MKRLTDKSTLPFALLARLNAEDYLRGIFEAGFFGHEKIFESELFDTQGPVLDCGCGNGIFAGLFSPEDYTGIDISLDSVRYAKLQFPDHFFQVMDARAMAFDDGVFKRCFVAGVFHHLGPRESQQILSEISRVLSHDGVLVVWEDIPARHPLNFPGHAAHSLDRGRYIRPAHAYRQDIHQYFRIDKEYNIRSGFMDYAVFRCSKGPSQ